MDPVSERICWKKDLGWVFRDSDDRAAGFGSNGNDFLPSTLVAGGFKLDQLLVEPFHTYRASLVRDAALADAIFIGGYGFTDAHVNRALRGPMVNAIARRPVMIADWAAATTASLNIREDRWAHELKLALYASGLYVGAGSNGPEIPHRLADQGVCEVSYPHRIAVWYGGFTGAAPVANEFAAWLDGGDDKLLGRTVRV